MTILYTQLYKVPVWVVIDQQIARAARDEIKAAFAEADAKIAPWAADTLPMTVNKLGTQGWHHIVNQPMPFKIGLDFLAMICSKHVEEVYGANKLLMGKSLLSIPKLDRIVRDGNDYVRLFNEVIQLEDALNISRLFDIAENCYYNKKLYKVFVSDGTIPKNFLQKVSERVITIGVDDADIKFDGSVEDTINESFNLIANLLNIKTN